MTASCTSRAAAFDDRPSLNPFADAALSGSLAEAACCRHDVTYVVLIISGCDKSYLDRAQLWDGEGNSLVEMTFAVNRH